MNALRSSALALALVGTTLAQGQYTDPQKRFSIRPPPGWQVNRPDDSGPVVFMTADGKARLILMPLDIPADAPLASVISAYEEFMGATQPGVQVTQLGEESIRIDGKPALLRKYRVSVPQDEVRLAEAAFIKNGVFSLTLHAHAPESAFSQHRATFERCRQSLRIPAAAPGAAPSAAGASAVAEIEAKLEALEAAREADIITGTEYRAKKAELEAQLAAARPPVLDEATRQKLEILERAFRAGLLNETEYARKRAEIEAAAAPAPPPLDAATREKLEALEAAHRSGILSDEEYASKRAELVGGGAPPAGTPIEGPAPRARGGAVSYRDPGGRFRFERPADWSPKPFPNQQGVILSRGEAAISVMVLPDAATPVSLAEGILGQIHSQWKNCQQGPRAAVTVGGQSAVVIPFSGTNPQGVVSAARLAALTHAGSGYALLFTAPAADAAAAEWAWGFVLKTFVPGGVAKGEQRGVEKRAGKTYRHVIGFSFWYPEGWKVQEHDDFLQIIPPNPGTSPEGPTELYLIVGDTVAGQGITSPQDPRVVQYMEMAVSELSPFVQRTGTIGTVPMTQGQGARIDWKGRNQQGKMICARTYVCILRESGIALLALAFEENLKRREAELVKIFASFGLGEGERDPQLVGTWGLVSTGAITNTSPFETDYSRARAVSEEQSTLQLLADGTWTRNDVSEFIAISGGLTVSSGPERKSSRGKWNAAQGSLYLIWDDGSWQDYKYQLQAGPQGRRLVLTGEKLREAWQGR